MKSILLIDDDPVARRMIASMLENFHVVECSSGEEGLERFGTEPFDLVICDLILTGGDNLETIRMIRREKPGQRIMVVSSFGTEDNLLETLRQRIVDFVVKPFTPNQLRNAVNNLLMCEFAIEVVSASKNWIELRVPASFQVADSLDAFFATLHLDIDEETRHTVSTAFRELLNNAIEHGCKGDPKGMIEVSYLRLKRGILYRIKDPGGGFDFGSIPHAALSNPEDDVLRHQGVRDSQGMRPGGYGLLFLRTLADELVYNERGNEVVYLKYLDDRSEMGVRLLFPQFRPCTASQAGSESRVSARGEIGK